MNPHYQFGIPAIIPLQAQIKDDWADNLIGAQYLEMPKGSHTRVGLPAEMVVTADQSLEKDFSFDNPQSRKVFSFHLLGYGLVAVEVSDFSVITELPEALEVLGEDPVDSGAHSS